jgi:hypothetical protein
MEKEIDKIIVASYQEDGGLSDYEDFVYNMQEALKDIGKGVWVIECKNANWRGQTGIMESEDPEKVIDAILMHDGQCRTEVWEDTEVSFGSAHIPEAHTKILQGVCYHHDCPTGSWFTITGNHE